MMGAYLPGASTLDLAGVIVRTSDPAKGAGALCSCGLGLQWSVFCLSSRVWSQLVCSSISKVAGTQQVSP